jgi:hypothetical protein
MHTHPDEYADQYASSGEDYESEHRDDRAEESENAAESQYHPMPWLEPQQAPAQIERQPVAHIGELSRSDLHQLLIDTIRLYEEEWQLARIWAKGDSNFLVAFLIPRGKRIDLQKAIDKQKVLKITINSQGGTVITPPKRRRFLWFF